MNKKLLGLVLFGCVLFSFTFCCITYGHEKPMPELENNSESLSPQIYCPVYPTKPVNFEIFTQYKGKRVYFSDQAAKETFENDPEKYLSLLPQFGGRGGTRATRVKAFLNKLVEPFGITTFSLLCLTALMGFITRRRPQFFKFHWPLALMTLISAACHVTLVILMH